MNTSSKPLDMTSDPEHASPNDAEDRRLLERVARRDREAFEALYRRYYQRTFQFVMRLARNEAAAEEIVSDTMFAVWQGAGSFEGASSVTTWLLGIAYRQGLKALDRNRKHAVVDSNDELLAQTVDSDPSADPESVAMTRSDSALLQRGLDSLSDRHRVVVELTAIGHSSTEISEILDCSENTVRTRMFYARQQLKRFLSRGANGGLRQGSATPATRPSSRQSSMSSSAGATASFSSV
jgi:RNA polymerase sigma-70 factor (ECF subfamily)